MTMVSLVLISTEKVFSEVIVRLRNLMTLMLTIEVLMIQYPMASRTLMIPKGDEVSRIPLFIIIHLQSIIHGFCTESMLGC